MSDHIDSSLEGIDDTVLSFAIIKPKNRLAQEKLSRAYKRALRDKRTYQASLRHFAALSPQGRLILNPSPDSERLVLRLALDLLPSTPRRGWRVGNGAGDIWLCADDNRREERLFTVSLNPRSGIMILQPNPQPRRSSELSLLNEHQSYVTLRSATPLFDTINAFRIRDCEYDLSWHMTQEGQERVRFGKELVDLLHRHNKGADRLLHAAADIFERSHTLIRAYRRSGVTLGEGASGVAYYGLEAASADPVAVKCIRIIPGRRAVIRQEIEAHKKLESSRYCLRLLKDLWEVENGCVHLVTEMCSGHFSANVYYNATEPLSKGGIWSLGFKTYLELWRDVFLGVRDTHAQGIMHRDINLKNLFVMSLSSNPARAVVADFGMAVSKDHGVCYGYSGPKHNLAPELEKGEEYDNAMDVYAVAYTMAETLGYSPGDDVRFSYISEARHEELMSYIQNKDDPNLQNLKGLLLSMLAWDPKRRIGMKEAVAHATWGTVVSTSERSDLHETEHDRPKKRRRGNHGRSTAASD